MNKPKSLGVDLMPNALDVLATVSGLGQQAVDTIINAVKENQRRLLACEGPHDCVPECTPRNQLVKKYQCKKCSGWMTTRDWVWYQEGLKHGRNQGKED